MAALQTCRVREAHAAAAAGQLPSIFHPLVHRDTVGVESGYRLLRHNQGMFQFGGTPRLEAELDGNTLYMTLLFKYAWLANRWCGGNFRVVVYHGSHSPMEGLEFGTSCGLMHGRLECMSKEAGSGLFWDDLLWTDVQTRALTSRIFERGSARCDVSFSASADSHFQRIREVVLDEWDNILLLCSSLQHIVPPGGHSSLIQGERISVIFHNDGNICSFGNPHDSPSLVTEEDLSRVRFECFRTAGPDSCSIQRLKRPPFDPPGAMDANLMKDTLVSARYVAALDAGAEAIYDGLRPRVAPQSGEDPHNPTHCPDQLVHEVFGRLPRQKAGLEKLRCRIHHPRWPRGESDRLVSVPVTIFPTALSPSGRPRAPPQSCCQISPDYYIAREDHGVAAQLTGRMIRSLGGAKWVHPTKEFCAYNREDLLDVGFGDCLLVVQVVSPCWIYCRTCGKQPDEWGLVTTAIPFVLFDDLDNFGDLITKGTQLWLGPKSPSRMSVYVELQMDLGFEADLCKLRPWHSWCCEFVFKTDVSLKHLKCPSREWGSYSPCFTSY